MWHDNNAKVIVCQVFTQCVFCLNQKMSTKELNVLKVTYRPCCSAGGLQIPLSRNRPVLSVRYLDEPMRIKLLK